MHRQFHWTNLHELAFHLKPPETFVSIFRTVRLVSPYGGFSSLYGTHLTPLFQKCCAAATPVEGTVI
jgi:hypothetical protein